MTRDELIETMARAMLESFKERVAVSAGKPFAETGVAEPLIDVFTDYASAAITAIEAAGLAIVPVEATDEMVKATDTDELKWAEGYEAEDIYSAMIEAGRI